MTSKKNDARVAEFMDLLTRQLEVAMSGDYVFTKLAFAFKAEKIDNPHPLEMELELSWPEDGE